MTGGLLFTLFTFPVHHRTRTNGEGGAHMRSNPQPGTVSSLPIPSMRLRPSVQIMQQDNKKTGLLFYQKHIPQTKSDVLLQFVFQYEHRYRQKSKFYHSFTITEVGWDKNSTDNARYVNSDYVKIDEFKTLRNGTGYITLKLTAPNYFRPRTESFLDYTQKLDNHNNFASDLTLTDMALEDDGDKNYYNVNIRDNYLLAKELLSRFNGQPYYGDGILVQREIYVYRHEYDRNFNGTPQDQLHANVQKFRVYGIEMELSDWKSSFAVPSTNPSTKKSNIGDLMTGPRQVKIILKIDRVVSSRRLTTYAKDTRLPNDGDDDGYMRSKMINVSHVNDLKDDNVNFANNRGNSREDVKDNSKDPNENKKGSREEIKDNSDKFAKNPQPQIDNIEDKKEDKKNINNDLFDLDDDDIQNQSVQNESENNNDDIQNQSVQNESENNNDDIQNQYVQNEFENNDDEDVDAWLIR